jgi:hypothetical protein
MTVVTPSYELSLEPISPELVLVTPELAPAARRLLPEPGESFWLLRVDDVDAVAEPGPPTTEGLLTQRLRAAAGATPRRLRHGVSAIAAATAAVAMLTLVADILRDGSRPARATSGSGIRPQQNPAIAASWRPVAGARYYDVQVYKGNVKVFETWSKTPGISLSRRWSFEGRVHRLSRGVYRLYAWPALRPEGTNRFGALIVRTFRIGTAAGSTGPGG